MLLIPARDSTDRPLLSQLRIRDVIRSLPFVMLVHLSKLKLKFLVGYLKDHAKVNYTRLVGKISLIFVANCCKLHESTTKLVHNFSSNLARYIYLGVHDGQSVHPYAPSTVLVFDSMMKKHAKQRVHHVRDFLLFRVLRMNVRHGYKPLLPYRHL